MDFERRFGGIRRLYGDKAFERFRHAHVCVVGVGGVGSWVAESLARSAVGRITLIDLDHIAESNTNRQIHALGDEYGKAKVSAMAQRISAINPACEVMEIEDFISEENLEALLGRGYDFVADAIDNAKVKAAMIHWCRRRKIKIITSGGAGGRIDPAKIMLDDLTRAVQDPLLSRTRLLLRREYGFPRDPKKKFGVECVFSSEPLKKPQNDAACDMTDQALTGLNCAGFGAVMTVTASFGLIMTARILRRIAGSVT
ncbi:MAG: tRNA threonylcarbamoyladenosine dehydratase [Methylobacillus sp.]|jgi:tRNA A37 threonylcarbamoyladenosine dehydratase|nr:tRNA threonylcarbamoyladenosine dehydratase [Methylobacillus sp.]